MKKNQYKLIAGMALLVASTTANAITINLDYSFDSNGFFTDTSRRTVMDAAASYFESRLTDDFDAITSAGGNSMTAIFFNPATTTIASVDNFSVATDTITVYAGGSAMTGNAIAWGGFGGWAASGSSGFIDTIEHRGESGDMYGPTATEFNPWGGSISFNSNYSDWYVDPDPSTSEGFSGIDFYSVALHELGHVLGLGIADSWDNLINSSNEFTGANAVAAHSGNVPLEDNGAHWLAGTTSFVDGVAQEAAMDPTISLGTRKLFTDLDLAALDDIGWDMAPIPLPPALLLFGSGILGILGLGRRRKHA